MKKIILSVLAVALCAAITVPLILSSAGDPLRFVVLGDSIAYGYGVASGKEYASLVTSELGFLKYNDAVNGQTSAGLLDWIDNQTVKEHLKNADIVEISIGGNDFLSQGQTILNYYNSMNLGALQELISDTIAKTKQNVESIVNKIIALNDDAKIVIQTLYTTNFNGMQSALELYIDSFNDAYYDAQKNHPENVTICDVRTAFKNSTKSLIQSDNIHPNENGHRLIADTVKQTLNSLGFKSTTATGTLKGDADSSGAVGAADVIVIKKYLARQFVEINKLNADINADGSIDVKDILMLKKKLISE